MLFIRKTTYLSGMALAVMLLTVSARANADVMPMDVEPPREVASRRELKKELSSLSVTLETSELELGDFLNRVTPRELYKGAGQGRGSHNPCGQERSDPGPRSRQFYPPHRSGFLHHGLRRL